MTDFQLTPIGTSPAWYNPGEPTSGFLLEAGGRRVLVDCGSGVVSRYLELFGVDAPIDAIVITHVHADHCLDLVPLAYGMKLGSLRGWPTPQLWLPPGAHARLQRLVGSWDADASFFTEVFDVREYSTTAPFDAAGLSVRALEVPHYIECWALRFGHGDASFGYTADLGPFEPVGSFMQGVDVLLAEAALTDDAATLGGADRGHICAREAGEIASAAGAHSLLLTHVPQENGFDAALAAARAAFDGPVALARSGEPIAIAQRLAVGG